MKRGSQLTLKINSLEFPSTGISECEGKKIYVEVKSTQGEKLFFRMSKYEFEFMNKYKEQYELYMVTNVKDDFPQYIVLHYDDIVKLKKEVINYQFTKY